MLRVAFADLAWIDAPMPDGSGPIRVARLPRLPDGHFRIFGRFPPGWLRTEAGHYPAFEEILVLEGALAIGDDDWRTGGYVWVPARQTRARTAAPTGCLAFARFGGAGRWVRGVADEPPHEPAIGCPDVRESAGDGSGVLHTDAGETSRIVMHAADVATAGAASAAGPTEWLSLADRTWCCTEPGEPAPDLAGPLFVRTLAGA